MSFTWSDQQTHIFNTVLDAMSKPDQQVIAIEAVAGAAKTSSMVELAKRVKQAYPSASIRYLVYGSMASQEARSKFGTTAIVSTLHSLAYHYEIKLSNPKRYLPKDRPFISWQDIPKYIRRPFGIDFDAIQLVDIYCNSHYTDYEHFLQSENTANLKPGVTKLAKDLMDAMYLGKMPCTHAFYLKVFHINLLNNLINLPQTDILIVDEAQDLTPITKAIFDKFPTKLKILIGDSKQSIFSWMGCVNAFQSYPNALTLPLTQSFRVNKEWAHKVESFMQTYLDKDFEFKGIDLPPMPKNPRHAYITRTNAELIGKMIELQKEGIPYHLATKDKVKQMFKLPVDIAFLKAGEVFELDKKDPLYEVKHHLNDWLNTPAIQAKYKTRFSYVMAQQLPEEIKAAVRLMVTYSPRVIIEIAEQAEKHTKVAADIWLMTAHTSKGKLICLEVEKSTFYN